MTPAFYEKALRGWMIAYGVMFVLAGLVFLLFRNELFQFINYQGALLGFAESPVPDGNHWFFLTMTNSMMVMIAYMSFAIAYDPRKYFLYLPIIILSKLASSATGLTFFFVTRCYTPACTAQGGLDGAAYYSNLVVFTSDMPLAIIAVVLYFQGKKYLFGPETEPTGTGGRQTLA
jgi:hypothetical protein